MFEPGYIGGKAGAGVYQAIIGQMPPHSVYVEPFFGSGAIFWHKRRAAKSILIDRDSNCIVKLGDAAGLDARVGNALDILPTLALPSDAVVYLDPPYPLCTRKGRAYYKFEMNDTQHEMLLALIQSLSCRVLISSYANPLYLQALRNWRCSRFTGQTRGGPREEMLWCNFDAPTELHDWRFAGRTFRERMTLKRLRGRWVKKFQAMPPLKQNFILSALTSTKAESGNAERPSTLESTLADPRANSGVGGHAPNLLLSFFPGIDLLGRGFEAEGYHVMRGPDTLFGQDIRGFTPPVGVCEGFIGGSPCQDFSKARRGLPPTGQGVELIRQFARCVTIGQPLWFLLENVPAAPNIEVPGYRVQRFNLNANECGMDQNRLRSFQFGTRDKSILVIPRSQNPHVESQPCAMASEAGRPGARSWADFCELQGLPRDFELPGWSKGAKYRAVGNGVPIPMARVIARAIRFRNVTGMVRVCVCHCGREVRPGVTLATAACRKRMQRARDAAAVTMPGIVTPAASQLALIPA